MKATRLPWMAFFLLVCLWSSQIQGQLTDERVMQSLRGGTEFLKSKQRPDGSWPDFDYAAYPTGVTSLCTLALLNAGMTAEDQPIRRALQFLRGQTELDRTYTVALQTLVLCAAEPKKDLRLIWRNVRWLETAQRTGRAGAGAGGWGYTQEGDQVDPSNSQFALLALHESDRVGDVVEIKDATWRLALAYWKRLQNDDGSFAYNQHEPGTGSMTCAGIGSLIIASGMVADLDATVGADGTVSCCGAAESPDQAIDKALTWLGDNFSARRNPSKVHMDSDSRLYYYLYAMERVGRLAGRRFLGQHDWYRAGVEVLLEYQDELGEFWQSGSDQLVSTAFSVLFLSKGRRPVLIGKLKRAPDGDWNHHRHDLAHLTAHVEQRWKKDLTWQVVDLGVASIDDLLQSPVLFLSGRDGLAMAQAEKESLRLYIERGGFLFAENCCDGEGFDRDFRALMSELFPDNPLRVLPPEHAIWFAEQRVDPKYLGLLEGIDACCRTGVVYCPANLSCYWELAAPRRAQIESLPEAVQLEVAGRLALGANVVTYATGRELKQKLDTISFASVLRTDPNRNRGTLHVAKLMHGGGSDDAPTALANVLAVMHQQVQVDVSNEKRVVSLVDPELPDYPVLYVHGRRSFRWNAAEQKGLKRFLDNGGVIVGDAICASDEFADAFRRELQLLFPGQWKRVPAEHPIFSDYYRGYDLSTVSLRDPRMRARADDPLSISTRQIAPLLEGIEINGRFVVLFSPYDMSCALENQPSLECRGYAREDAARLAINMLLYAMQQ